MKTLILVPTPRERESLQGPLSPVLCGFGPVVAAARTAQLILERAPERVLLVGIAGTYDPERFPLGSALEFSAVAIHGLGAGDGEDAPSPRELGFDQLSSEAGSPRIQDEIDLRIPGHPSLLTVCRAAGSLEVVAQRRRLFPAAAAEDMEGFGVAVACELKRVSLRIVRGISNIAGDRKRENWRIEDALQAARHRLHEILEGNRE